MGYVSPKDVEMNKMPILLWQIMQMIMSIRYEDVCNCAAWTLHFVVDSVLCSVFEPKWQ